MSRPAPASNRGNLSASVGTLAQSNCGKSLQVLSLSFAEANKIKSFQYINIMFFSEYDDYVLDTEERLI